MIFFDLLDWPYATFVYSVVWYLFFRIITIHTRGRIILSNRMRLFLFPLSHRQTTNFTLATVLIFSYIEFLLFLISRIPYVTQYIGSNFEDYNLACMFLLFLSTSSAFFEAASDIRGNMPASPIIEKVLFFLAILIGIGIIVGCLSVVIAATLLLVRSH